MAKLVMGDRSAHARAPAGRPTRILDLYKLGLAEAARGIRDGIFSSEELTVSCLARIRRHEPKALAWVWQDHDQAIANARQADALIKRNTIIGPLHGIPLGVKDIILTKGIPTRMGSPIFKNFIPSYSATCVAKLEAAGAFVMGKTVTTEFASQHPGKTRNPWDTSFTPGGSSSGSAAAVAAGFVAGALGSQTRGSTIRPAIYCGIVGYKPSFGLISRYGVNPLSVTLDHLGVLTRSIDDAGLLASCLMGYDPLDPATAVRSRPRRSLDDLSVQDKPPRLAAVRSPLWHLADRSQQELFVANQETLRREGAHVEEVELPAIFRKAVDVAKVIQLSEIAHSYRPLMSQFSRQVSERFTEYYEKGLTYTAVEYLDALQTRERLQHALNELLKGHDAIITPPATGEAPKSLKFTGDANFCTVWTLCGVPCVTFPTGVGLNCMPMGLQVVGPYVEDRETLRVLNGAPENFRLCCDGVGSVRPSR